MLYVFTLTTTFDTGIFTPNIAMKDGNKRDSTQKEIGITITCESQSCSVGSSISWTWQLVPFQKPFQVLQVHQICRERDAVTVIGSQ